MLQQCSISEAKNRLAAIVQNVESGGSVRLTRRGKPVAVLVSIEEYQRLTEKRKDFWAALTEFRKFYEEEGLEGLSGREFEGIRDPSAGREVSL